jgi:thiosulfate dehydrogenase [quinone] large subunit
MFTMKHKLVEWFLRITLSIGMLSAVADRFGLWNEELSAWGNWQNFVAYTHQLNPWIPVSLIGTIAGIATILEILFGISLLTPFKTSYVAKATGILLLLFGVSMATFLNIKAPLDYSVFIGAAAAFALGLLTKK